MKKIILSISVLAMAGLAACSNKEKEADTTGAVPAEVVATDVESADIIISEDSIPAPVIDDAAESAAQAQENLNDAASDTKAAVKEAGDALEEKGTELKEKGKEKLAEGAKKVSEKAAKVADKLSE